MEKVDFNNENGNYNIINNNEFVTSSEKGKGKRRSNSMEECVYPYVSSLIKDKENPKNRKQLNLVSEFDNFHKNSNFSINNLNKNEDNQYSTQAKETIKTALQNKLNSCKKTKVNKVVELTSSLFTPDFYENTVAGKIHNFYSFFGILFYQIVNMFFEYKDN